MYEKRILVVVFLVTVLASIRRLDLFLPTPPIPGDVVATIVRRTSSANHSDPMLVDPDPAVPHGPIPHILWFTYRHDILQLEKPVQYYENVKKTILAYRTAWNESDAPVRFLVDDNCTQLLLQVDRQENTTLAEAFKNEGRGDLRADLCRLAALYLHGGYYFDVDLEVVKPVIMDPKVSFSTARDKLFGYLFQAYLASIPGHPILRENLHTMMEFYFKREGHCWLKAREVMGPCTLVKAWNQTNNRGHTRMLQETHLLWHKLYPNMTVRGSSDPCHWVVHDPLEKEVYFYSRILGSSKCW